MSTNFAKTRTQFHLPEDLTYLVGNSLGPMPLKAKERIASLMTDEWATMKVGGWRKGGRDKEGWFVQPSLIGDRVGKLIGAPAGTVMVGDTLSVQIYQALGAALALRPERKIILSDSGNFPTDLYMAQGLIKTLGKGHKLKIVEPDQIEANLTDEVAVLLITEVDYKTSRLHSMKDLTTKAHAVGALTVWDLAHSAGALPIDLLGTGADFAAGCTYKFLNAGPGSPAFIYVAPKHIKTAEPVLAGWMGHANPFDFDTTFEPSLTIERMRIGTPPVLGMAALEIALDVWDDVSLEDVRARSIELSELMIKLIQDKCPQLKLDSPKNPQSRGSHLAFSHIEGYAIVQALIANKVMADFRAPDTMRFAFTPLYTRNEDIHTAVETLAEILETGAWNKPEFKALSKVT